MILAIDPGNVKSAYVSMGKDVIYDKGIDANEGILERIECATEKRIVIEMIASYGMAVGKSVFETCVWIGKFMREAEFMEIPVTLVYRKDIKLHLCQSMRAKDSNIIQALKDRYGEVGTKKNPGALYGISQDMWSALAVGTFYLDMELEGLKNGVYL
jgi:hypothetical protein